MEILLLFFLFCNCLIFHEAQARKRIIGGSPAYTADYPFLAAIYKTTADGQYFCSGTILNQRWILTAGQCVDGATLFTILVGTNNIKTPGSTSVKLATEEYILHPDYNPNTLENDVGLIKTRLELTYTSYIKAVRLATFDVEPSTNYGQMAVVGWGQTSDDTTKLSDELHFVRVELLLNEECKLTYGNQITDKMICVAGNYNEGTCHGDTGTPLVLTYRISKEQHAISSFVSGNGCESTDPSGFTRIYPYLSWIQNITNLD